MTTPTKTGGPASKHSTEVMKPEVFAAAIDELTNTHAKSAYKVAIECEMHPRTAYALAKKLQEKYQPLAANVRAVATSLPLVATAVASLSTGVGCSSMLSPPPWSLG